MDFRHDPDFINSRVLSFIPGNPLQVYAGWSISRNCAVVYKVLSVMHDTNYLVQYFKQEYELAFRCASSNICRVFEYKVIQTESQSFYCIVMEKLDRDWNQEILAKQAERSHYDEKTLWERLYVLVATLAALQTMNVAHRDIKPQNIFLTDSGQLKLGDFGSGREISQLSMMQTLQGTPYYLSPKAQRAYQSRGQRVDQNAYKSDAYSLGMTFFHACLFELQPEWYSLSQSEFKSALLHSFIYSNNLKDVLICMIEEEEEMRPDFIKLAEWLGIKPDLECSIGKNEGLFCYQCGENSQSGNKLTGVCGHEVSFCKKECWERFLEENEGGVLICKECMANMPISSLQMTSDFHRSLSPILYPSLPLPSVNEPDVPQPMALLSPDIDTVQQSVGICESCRRKDNLFQICHPICFECASKCLNERTSMKEQPGCSVCRVKFPSEMLEFLGFSP